MKKHLFMKPSNVKYKGYVENSLKELIADEYRREVELSEINDKQLFDYLKRMMQQARINRKISELKQKLTYDSDIKKKVAEACLNDIELILNKPESYYEDLAGIIYMGLLYIDPKNDFFDDCIGVSQKKSDARERIQSVWCRKNKANMTNKEEVRKNYPIPIRDTTKIESDARILSIPGGCDYYHNTMISLENLCLFDLNEKSDSYQKFSFHKMHGIYEELKDKPIENLLLMEYSLGIGFANYSYSYIRGLKSYDELKMMSPIIREATSITQIFLRKEIMKVLWGYYGVSTCGEHDIKNMVLILNSVRELITDVFEKTLEVWWYTVILKKVKCNLYDLKLSMEVSWRRYFDENCIYQDWIDFLRTKDWRSIKTVEDCFCKNNHDNTVMDFFCYDLLTIIDVMGRKCTIRIERSTNEIGNMVLSRCQEKFRTIELPDDEKKVHKLFLTIRKEMFEQIQREEQSRFCVRDLKVRNNLKKVNVTHIYAVIMKDIIAVLLLKN